MTGRGMLAHDWYDMPLPSNVRMGRDTWLHSTYSLVHHRSVSPAAVRLGRDCGIYRGTFFDLGPSGEVWIGDVTTVVGAIFSTNSRIQIGSYCFIAHEVVIADDSWARPAGDRTSSSSGGGITIGDDVWIGSRSVVLGGSHIGDGSIIGAGSIVTGLVPPDSLVAGNPARVVRSVAGGDRELPGR